MASQSDDIARYAHGVLDRLEADGLRRQMAVTRRAPGGSAVRDGKTMVCFCDNDYLGLSQHPRVIAAARDAAAAFGAGAGASRLVAGNAPLNEALESRIATLKGLEAARVFGSGYLANIGAIPVLAGRGDVIVLDELSHACMRAGAQLSGAETEIFKHNDLEDAEAKLRQAAKGDGRTLVLAETVYSMDGDLAPLAGLNALCDAYGAWLMTDDAHGFGVVDQANPAPIQMGTLSKACGAYGGYVAGPKPFVDLLTSRARSLVFTTGLPPAILGAALAALDVMADEPWRRARALDNAALFCREVGLPAPESAIVPLILGDPAATLAASARLEAAGFLVTAIRPPTVPRGTSRLRITFSADHDPADVVRLARLVGEATDGIRVEAAE